MVCKKCGEKIPKNQTFCHSCGTSISEPVAEEPKKSKVGLIAGIIAIVLIICIAVCLSIIFLSNGNDKNSNSGTSSSNSKIESNKPEDAVTDFTQKLASGDAEGAFKCSAYDMEYYINAILDSDDAYKEAFKEEYGTADYKGMVKAFGEETKAELEEQYGTDVKITVKISKVEPLSKDDFDAKIKELEEGLEANELGIEDLDIQKFLPTKKITEISKVTFDTILKGEKGEDTETNEVYCAKIDGNWKVLETLS